MCALIGKKAQTCKYGDKCRYQYPAPDSAGKETVRYDALAALGPPNPIDTATGEPRKCLDCGSQFHDTGSSKCKRADQTVAALSNRLSQIERNQMQTADVLLRISENLGRLQQSPPPPVGFRKLD